MPKISMSQVKVAMTAIAGTIVALAGAQEAGLLTLIPSGAMHKLTEVGVLLGILGASPLGRLLFKDAPSNDIVPPAERGTPGVRTSETEITKP